MTYNVFGGMLNLALAPRFSTLQTRNPGLAKVISVFCIPSSKL